MATHDGPCLVGSSVEGFRGVSWFRRVAILDVAYSHVESSVRAGRVIARPGSQWAESNRSITAAARTDAVAAQTGAEAARLFIEENAASSRRSQQREDAVNGGGGKKRQRVSQPGRPRLRHGRRINKPSASSPTVAGSGTGTHTDLNITFEIVMAPGPLL